jgi:fluoroquinolone resistance protein
MDSFIDGVVFEKENFTLKPLVKGVYEQCVFKLCDFSGSNLNDLRFSECLFDSCNLSMAKLINTAFNDVRFKNCKMLGMHFDDCNPLGFTVNFENCNLAQSVFFKVILKKALFMNSRLTEADLTEADFTSVAFENCDFSGATFYRTILEKTDLSSSFNYVIDPEKNNIRKARFSLHGIAGLLTKYNIEIV